MTAAATNVPSGVPQEHGASRRGLMQRRTTCPRMIGATWRASSSLGWPRCAQCRPMSHCRPDRTKATVHLSAPEQKEKAMSRCTGVALAIAVAAATAIFAAPAALAKDGDVRVKGTCTSSATSKLRLSAENVASRSSSRSTRTATASPWHVTLRKNGVSLRRRPQRRGRRVAPSQSVALWATPRVPGTA